MGIGGYLFKLSCHSVSSFVIGTLTHPAFTPASRSTARGAGGVSRVRQERSGSGC
jgi:hypothetical protein